jgi:hypothetical protein
MHHLRLEAGELAQIDDFQFVWPDLALAHHVPDQLVERGFEDVTRRGQAGLERLAARQRAEGVADQANLAVGLQFGVDAVLDLLVATLGWPQKVQFPQPFVRLQAQDRSIGQIGQDAWVDGVRLIMRRSLAPAWWSVK